MTYLNMGHDDIDYEHQFDTTNKTLSYTLNNQSRINSSSTAYSLGNGAKHALRRQTFVFNKSNIDRFNF